MTAISNIRQNEYNERAGVRGPLANGGHMELRPVPEPHRWLAEYVAPGREVPAVRLSGPALCTPPGVLRFGKAVAEVDESLQGTAENFLLRALDFLANDDATQADIHNEAAAEGHGPRYPLLSAADLAALPVPVFTVDGFLVHDTTAGLVGPTGAGKTFTGLDLALSVAAGLPWQGHSVRQGDTVYVTPEGVGGLARRVAAWCQHHGVANTLPAYFVTVPVNLLNTLDPPALIASIRTTLGPEVPELIVIDTLNRSMVGGNENSQEDMTVAVEAADTIRRAFRCCLVLVHHTGYTATDRARGSSVLPAALDTILLQKLEATEVTVETIKQKDCVMLPPLRLRLRPEGESCVLVANEASSTAVTPAARTALRALREIELPDEGVTFTDWLTASGLPKGTFLRVRTDLVTSMLVIKTGKRYMLSIHGYAEDSRNRES